MKSKPSVWRVIKACAVIDCEWNTIRDIQMYRHRLSIPDCKNCYVGPVEIRPVGKVKTVGK